MIYPLLLSMQINFFFFNFVLAVVFHSLSCVQLFANPWTAALQASLSFSVSWSLLKLMPFESVMLSNHLILCRLLLLLPSVFTSIRVFSSKSARHIRWPKYWSFGISPSKIFRVDFFKNDQCDLLAVHGTV